MDVDLNMTHYNIAKVASEIANDPKLEVVSKPTHLAKVATEVQQNLKIAASKDQDAEWHRVNSYIADILKDAHVLYAKLARLQSDFSDVELAKLEKISERVLELGEQLSQFSKGFYEGKIEMVKEFSYSGPGGSAQLEVSKEEPESAEEPTEADLDIELDLEGESDFSDYEEEESEGEPKEASSSGEGRGEGGEGGVEEEDGKKEEEED